MEAANSAKVILLVEDDHEIRKDLAALLESEGYQVKAAENGKAALAILAEGPPPPALIMLDIMMPVMDGWQFRAAQIQNKDHASIPVVVVTADGHAPQKAAKMGAQGYIQKPIIDFDRFLKTIARLVA